MGKSPEFINVKTAIERGYGSRATLARWARKGDVRSYRQGSSLMLSVVDLEAVKASHAAATTEETVVENLARQLANVAPALSPEGRAKLAELLR